MNFVYNGTVEGSTADLVDLTKYAKDLHVQGLVNDGSNNGQKSKPLIELLETTSKANSQLEQLNEMDSPSESEDELCIVFEKNTASCSKLPSTSTEVTKSKSSKEHDARNSRKRQLSPASQSPSQAPLKKGTKTPAPASSILYIICFPELFLIQHFCKFFKIIQSRTLPSRTLPLQVVVPLMLQRRKSVLFVKRYSCQMNLTVNI